MISTRTAATWIVALAVTACAGPGLAQPPIGEPAPEFTLTDLDGATHSLADWSGRTVVLEWINPNCPISRRHAEAGTMQSTADAHPDVVWVAVNSTSPTHRDHLSREAHKAYLADHGISYPVLEDPQGEVGRAYGAKTTPHMYVVDPGGRLVYAGAIDDDPRGNGAQVNYVSAALEAVADGRSPDPATTRAYGCSVKY